jgi:uncharacterized protein (DUF849 family)
MLAVVRRIKVCLNGSRSRAEHPAVPLTGAEAAAAAAGAVAAGAEAVHVHPRGAAGEESLRSEDVAATVEALRRAGPGTPVGVSTGLWITGGDVDRRRDLVARWDGLPVSARPDFASVNVSEPGFGDLAGGLHRIGIGVEAGVWSVADADVLAEALAAALADAAPPVRILVEVIGGPAADAVAAADEILARLDRHGLPAPRLLHGEGEACWPLVAHAGRLGLPTRIGLEDTLVGPDGSPARDNATLVRQAITVWERGRGTAEPSPGPGRVARSDPRPGSGRSGTTGWPR